MSEMKSEGLGKIFAPLKNKDEFWEQALRLSEQRLTVLASNIANADTDLSEILCAGPEFVVR